MRRIVIVGSTGSIGTQALDVIQSSPDLEVVGLAAASSWELLLEQSRDFGVRRLALADADAAARAAEHATVLAGPEGLVELITDTDCDLVLNALVGSAGLGPTIATLGEGIDLALANKESLVVGGELVMALAEATGAHLIPVDSEHSALFQLLEGQGPGTVDRLVLTASGGPFRGRTDLDGVTVDEALAHPTWSMGGKITIDSATLMNKGLELIEAHHLFGLSYDRIDVVVHPQSIVHALVQLNDGASLAHLGHPDMRVPISYALHHPQRADVPVPLLDLAEVGALTFERPDSDTFACLRLAREAAGAGGTAPCVLNAANEVAVHAFLRGELAFTGIARVIESTLGELPTRPVRHFSDLYEADAQAREVGEGGGRVSWFLAFAGFAVLVILHELGHFTAAKAVGMRVEKFSLFFPPTLLSKKVGETEYAIGAIPAGGYVRISGMNPSEDLPEEVRDRAYHSQPVWKRIVVIAAGPAVNLVVAFILLWIFFAAIGPQETTGRVSAVEKGMPAERAIKPGDTLVAVDGVRGAPAQLSKQIQSHKCAGTPHEGCKATTSATLLLKRDGKLVTVKLTPVYDANVEGGPPRTRLGFGFSADGPHVTESVGGAFVTSADQFWFITKQTVSLPARLINPEQRKQISGVVGSYEVTRQTILSDIGDAVGILAIISLSLAIVNLFPFLPLDGGHIFWAVVEKVRRKPVPFAVMERAGVVGFMLVILIFLIGLSNDIGRLSGEGFQVR